MGTPRADEQRQDRFRQLYETHYGAVLAYARRRVVEADARDIAAETFLVAWRRFDEASKGGLPWLYRTANLTWRNHTRAELRAENLKARMRSADRNEDPSDMSARHADHQYIIDAVATLPERDRELLFLVTWEQLTIAEAARAMEMTTAAATVRLHRARRRLHRLLGETNCSAPAPLDTRFQDSRPR